MCVCMYYDLGSVGYIEDSMMVSLFGERLNVGSFQ